MMSMDTFITWLDEYWVVLLLIGIPLFYSYMLLHDEKIDLIRPKGSKPLSDKVKKAYAHDAGMVMLVTGLCFIGVFILWMFISAAGYVLSVAVLAGFVVMWMKVYKKYE